MAEPLKDIQRSLDKWLRDWAGFVRDVRDWMRVVKQELPRLRRAVERFDPDARKRHAATERDVLVPAVRRFLDGEITDDELRAVVEEIERS